MEEEKNVFLTVVHKNDEVSGDEVWIDFSLIWQQMKRFFVLWLCLSIALGSLTFGTELLRKRISDIGSVQTILTFSNASYDITKIKSPVVVEDALNALNMETEELEDVRNAIQIKGMIPDTSYEQMSMYYNLISESTPNLNAVQSLLDTQYSVSNYVVSLDYFELGMTQDEGIIFLNELVNAYQNYCTLMYNQNTAISNPLSSIDYREYDYAEAANIFSTLLDNAVSYLSRMENEPGGGTFRSTETGFAFRDLRQNANLLKNIDLDRISSYIVIHSVSTNEPDTQISYYEWLIENLTQQRAVQRTRVYSLQDSINSYNKDSIIIISGPDGLSNATGSEDINANYDLMIQQELDAQNSIASYTRSITYYQYVIEGFQNAQGVSSAENIEWVEERLQDLNEKVNTLIQNIFQTVDDYYEQTASSTQIRIIIPATLGKSDYNFSVRLIVIVEALLLVAYFSVAAILGVYQANAKKAAKPSETVPDDDKTSQ